MTSRVEGIIIDKKAFREADRIFTIYTKERGKLDALAQGCRKVSSKLNSHLELLNYARFTLAKGKTLDRIATVDTIASFPSIKSNLDHCACALFFCEVLKKATHPDLPERHVFDAVQKFFSDLETLPKTPARITKKAVVRLGSLFGYRRDAKGALNDLFESSIADLVESKPLSRAFFDHLATTKLFPIASDS